MPIKTTLIWILGALGLALTLLPSVFVFTGAIPLSQHKTFMAIGMILWFAAAPYLTRQSGAPKQE